LKLFSTGPLFRYERPQKGRQRQFHQINFEVLGVAEPLADAELICMAWRILQKLSISDKVQLEINSLGDKESRESYRDALVRYFSAYKSDLSEDSLKRLEKNPLRILDSKDEGDKVIVKKAPTISEYYNQESKAFFDAVCTLLKSVDVPFTINPYLVRGLDYYCHTAFEFTTTQLGSQNAVLAGGRYDALIEMMGGPSTPAVGFAGGVERLVALSELDLPAPRPVVVVPIGQKAEEQGLWLADKFRLAGIYTELGYSGNVGKRFKRAAKLNALATVTFGEDEVKKGLVNLKFFDTSEEESLSVESAILKLVDMAIIR
jgi:histidyl-tRNA synthetase